MAAGRSFPEVPRPGRLVAAKLPERTQPPPHRWGVPTQPSGVECHPADGERRDAPPALPPTSPDDIVHPARAAAPPPEEVQQALRRIEELLTSENLGHLESRLHRLSQTNGRLADMVSQQQREQLYLTAVVGASSLALDHLAGANDCALSLLRHRASDDARPHGRIATSGEALAVPSGAAVPESPPVVSRRAATTQTTVDRSGNDAACERVAAQTAPKNVEPGQVAAAHATIQRLSAELDARTRRCETLERVQARLRSELAARDATIERLESKWSKALTDGSASGWKSASRSGDGDVAGSGAALVEPNALLRRSQQRAAPAALARPAGGAMGPPSGDAARRLWESLGPELSATLAAELASAS